jgi:sugar phosphate isomerase/epimerase
MDLGGIIRAGGIEIMPDTTKESKELEEIKEVFRERGINYKCECCGNDTWILQDTEGGVVFAELEPFRQYSLKTVVIICRKCGNIRFFSKNVLGIEGKTDEPE